ncbi:MAG: hypothetical protein NTY17_13965 [Planctomycetia bacterium]|nr:hypothetical protein [Planctomycetia bacterium]
MTPATATLDAVDRAFLWHADRARRHPSRPSQVLSIGAAAAVSEAIAPRPAAAPLVPAAAIHPQPITDDGLGTLVDRLLRVVPHAWSHLAKRVEDAHRDGAEVIAITGARRGEGRTTLVGCLARALMARGRRVECHDRVPLGMASAGPEGGTIVLVDVGVWFPGGPLRRAWLERQSLGCHAVILVRSADQPACPARAVALEAVGLKVLGEVLTMTPPATTGIRIH